ncbi:MAG: DNA mismatch repair protein MutS [Alphaproteobacteria bacterium]|nr:DNA mismatch repair protein MutS [Alphaproteobacteria bacterium]
MTNTQSLLNFGEPDVIETGKPPLGMSPVMAQYWEMKQQYHTCLLFFRMGDFYELFFEDAIVAAKALDIALTKRGKQEGEEIPMCGVPAHTYEIYLAKLIQKGFKVAVCEQMEDPAAAKKRGAKGPLRRDVVRVVTAGTLTEEGLLDARQNNFLVALSPVTQKAIGVGAIDLSTGVFLIEETTIEGLASLLARLNPAEIVLPDRLLEEPALYETFGGWKKKLSPLPQARFDEDNSRRRLEEVYHVQTLDAFGKFTASEIRAAGALIDYIYITQKSALTMIERPRKISSQGILMIDPATRRSLELEITLNGQRQGTLLSTIDRTLTAAGSRLLSLRLNAPLTQVAPLLQRLDMVTFFVEASQTRGQVREALKSCPDMERALSRINLGRGSPRDLAALRDGLRQAETIQNLLGAQNMPEPISRENARLGGHTLVWDRLNRALADSLPPYAREGGFMATGYHEELDHYRVLRDNSFSLTQKLQAEYITKTGVNTLKIRHNNVIGYHVDIGPSHAQKMSEEFIHRQTLGSSIRYTTLALSELEREIESAAHHALTLELQLFADLVAEVQGRAPEILQTCRALASLDVAASLAQLAVEENYVRPIVDDTMMFDIKGGRHPVVETALKSAGNTPFVANDCLMDDAQKLILMTGPNMAGKSTFLRQNAVIILLAQMGSYVPATTAHIGIVDRIFSRVGAADDLAAGRSTFMVEMVETAAILHQATARSFVILDEIGRGTATFDGLSIAWAVVESLCRVNKSRALFATHYHELTQLTSSLPMMVCATMRIKEWNGDVIFLHEVIPGCADKSYGIHVAALAGLPALAVERAKQVLAILEGERKDVPIHATQPLDVSSPPVLPTKTSRAEEALQELSLDDLSPRQALDELYRLKGLVSNSD